MFLVQLTVPASRLPLGGYLIFQPCATLVLIRRATSVVPRRSHHMMYRRDFAQILFTLWFFAGFIPVFISIALRDIWTNTDSDTCGAMYHIRGMAKISSISRAGSTSTGSHGASGGQSPNGAATLATATSTTIGRTTRSASQSGPSSGPDRPSTDKILHELLKDCQFTFENCAALYAATLSGKSVAKGSKSSSSGSNYASSPQAIKGTGETGMVRSSSQVGRNKCGGKQ
ncbi:hypothetical protein BCR44DRAFT_1441569 [Catenaria anguillulae PL171]|uniref:Uncharacterized protein n=1 Tax=Catenaria anguillulae PL171 TaxID=765915 RepID=A0A1Y2HCP5_9FUNG|nr:hypothetical protein BCR44DRAFT_1441569 [Catenaria anguillulae PL171]